MIVMTLDHVRYFFTDVTFPPEDLTRTWPALFLTRWVTHFCAPAFFLLAGMSAFLGNAPRSFLLTRCLWLIVLELTVIGFAWSFTPGYNFAGVIWALGCSMIALAALSSVPRAILLIASVIVITIPPSGEPSILLRPGNVSVFGRKWFVLYPLLPWLAIMTLGFSIAAVWTLEPDRRQRILAVAGAAACALFALLAPKDTWMAFLNAEKYPPSLQYTLMTIGPSLLILAAADRWLRRQRGVVLTFGRVPFFFYLCHLFLIHGLAALIGVERGSGFSLPIVWLLWVVIVAILYVPSRWFESVKRARRDAWLRYL